MGTKDYGRRTLQLQNNCLFISTKVNNMKMHKYISFYTFMKEYVVSLSQEWNDYNCIWNKTEYGDVDGIRIHPRKLWTPDLLMYNR